MSTLNTAIKVWPETKTNEWTLVNETWVHKDAKVSVPKENLKGGYIRSGNFFENAKIFDKAKVFGNSKVFGYSKVFGDSQVFGDSRIYGNSQVCGDIQLSESKNIFTISNIGSRKSTITIVKSDCGNIFMTTGCYIGTLNEFKEAVKKTHGNNRYAKEYESIYNLINIKFINNE